MRSDSYRVFLRAALDRKGRTMGVVSSIVFAVAYAFSIGMVYWSSIPIPDVITVPRLEVITAGPIGLVPWIVVYLDRYWVISVSLEAFLWWLTLTVLVGLNVSAFYYLRRDRLARGWCCSRVGGTLATLASVLPASFAVFACCGGGVVTLLLFSACLLPLVAGSMLYYGRLLSVASVCALLILQLWLYRTWLKGRSGLQIGGVTSAVARREEG
jgi:hypothetical protein